ncbi:hypothetical protein HYZ99_02125 [Candidatus Peregrinibacteria bacterium]|nr:hypothetical protein [Candidatus Peregrinibacteria bacterium]
MNTHIHSLFTSRLARLAGFALVCVMGSFVVGVQTAGDIHPFAAIQADEITESGLALSEIAQSGDIDGSGELDLQDAIAILEIVQGYDMPTLLQLKADPNGDNRLTVEDALRILRTLAVR